MAGQESSTQSFRGKGGSLFSGLRPRIITGLAMAAVVLWALFLAPLWLLGALIAFLAGVGMWEYSRLVLPGPWGLEAAAGVILAAGIPLAGLAVGAEGVVGGLGLALVLVSGVALGGPGELYGMREGIIARALGVFYTGGLFGCLLLLAMRDNGRVLVFFSVASVALADVGAYFTGKALGKHSLARRISPKKTVEGLLGGMMAAGLTGMVISLLCIPRIAWWQGGLIAMALAGVSVVGDLFESLIKRVAGAKDSAGFLPGHGGVLDRVDAHLAAAPVLLLIWASFFSELPS